MPGKNEQDPKRTRKISLEKQKSYINEQEYHQKNQKIDHGRRNVFLFLAGTSAGVGLLMLNPFGFGKYLTEKGAKLVNPNNNSNLGSSEQSISQPTLETAADFLPVPIENNDSTSKIIYQGINFKIPKGKALLIAVQRGTKQVSSEFSSVSRRQDYIRNKKRDDTPLYKQPQMYPEGDVPEMLFLGQNFDSYGLLILAGSPDGTPPRAEFLFTDRLPPENLLNADKKMREKYPELELGEVEAFPNFNNPLTKPTDEHFALINPRQPDVTLL